MLEMRIFRANLMASLVVCSSFAIVADTELTTNSTMM